jgi:hypothetical protein
VHVSKDLAGFQRQAITLAWKTHATGVHGAVFVIIRYFQKQYNDINSEKSDRILFRVHSDAFGRFRTLAALTSGMFRTAVEETLELFVSEITAPV